MPSPNQKELDRCLHTLNEQIAGGVHNLLHMAATPDGIAKAVFIVKLLQQLQDFLRSEKMARKTYGIEAKIDFDDESRHEHALKLIKKTAKTLLTQLNLLADGRTPKVIIRTEDLFEGVEDIPLDDPEQQV